VADKTDNIDEPQAEKAEAAGPKRAAGTKAPDEPKKPVRRTRKAPSAAAADAAETAAEPEASPKPRARARRPKAPTETAAPEATPSETAASETAAPEATAETTAVSAEKAAGPAGRPPRARRPGRTAKADVPQAAAAPATPARRKPAVKAAKTPAVPKPKAEPKTGAPGKATVVDAAGKQLETLDLRPELFAVPANVNTLHLVVRASQAARRRGTASSKNRGEVSGSTAKLYRQKGTGRARVGSVKSPTRVGGGVAFGPRPRGYDIKVNRKVVRKALAMALTNRADNGHIFVARELDLDAPSTAGMNQFLVGLDVAAPVLVVTDDEPNVTLSTRNLVYAESAEVATLTTEQVLRARSLVLTQKAFSALNEA
jgi:large subunit ribosomal protein L4